MLSTFKAFWSGFLEGFKEEVVRQQPYFVWATFVVVLYIAFRIT